MAKKYWSALTDDLEHCIECGREPVQFHHVFFGYSSDNRDHSTDDGYIIPLCMNCHFKLHTDPNHRVEFKWKRIAQAHWESIHTRDDFRKRYGKSYL